VALSRDEAIQQFLRAIGYPPNNEPDQSTLKATMLSERAALDLLRQRQHLVANPGAGSVDKSVWLLEIHGKFAAVMCSSSSACTPMPATVTAVYFLDGKPGPFAVIFDEPNAGN